MKMEASSPVWVGGLSFGVNESILSDLFSKFGSVKSVVVLRDDTGKSKQCGFVNFVSVGAAEAAAIALNSCDILGETIKTRGPAELLARRKTTSTFTTASHDRKDYRALTDCMFYVNGNECLPKTGECPYRHSKRAQQSDLVCVLWLQKQCSDINCPNRHPRLTKPNSDEPVRVQPARCPSHNAFKCTGECGFADCNTHFMEQESMQEHISKGRERQIIPSAACTYCKAVFFSEEEREYHACFNIAKTDSTAPVPPINSAPQQPRKQCVRTNGHSSTYCSVGAQSNSEAHCACNVNTVKVAQVLPRYLNVCSSCGTCYENSGDSLSNFESTAGHPCGTGGHMCPNSPSVRKGQVAASEIDPGHSTGNDTGDPEPIGVFWDIENCPVPRGRSAQDVVQKIRGEFFSGRREVEFMCVCDISKEKREVIEELNKAQVTVVHINATSKNAADDKLRQSLRRFAQSYPAPASVVLVSGDINFAAELSDLRHRHNLRVICLHNAQAQTALLTCAHEAHRFDHFTSDLPFTLAVKVADDAGLSSELTVLNLPLGKDTAQIKIKLKKLSDNCGGKVVSVTGRCAVIRFPNPLSAARAKKRMDKEDVFGSAIQVVYSTGDVSRYVGSPNKTKKRTDESKGGTKNGNNTTFRLLQRDKTTASGSGDTNSVLYVNIPEKLLPDGRVSSLIDKGSLSDGTCTRSEDHITQLQSKYSVENKDQSGSKQNVKQTVPPQQYLNQPGFLNNNAYPNIWPNQFYHNMLNMPSQASGIPGITPLAGPIVGAPPHLTASWLANLHNLSILEQQRGGIDLLVTNLDETVSKKELKKKLASVFREHCKVYSVILHSGEGIPLRAFIKVPKISDAHLAMLKVNQQQIFNTNVTVTIASEKEKELCFLRCEVTSILKETPLHWTPLNKFLSEYYEKCSKSFDTNSLNLIQDLVLVNGTPGNQTISLVTHAVATAYITVEHEAFAWEVHGVLRGHTGEVEVVAFAALYWLKYGKMVEVAHNGVTLESALNKVPNVFVTVKENESKVVTWIKQGARNGGNLNKLMELGKELKDLLRVFASFRLSLSNLISEYQKHYGKREPFDPMVYGFSSVIDLLEALPCIVQIYDNGSDRYITLTHEMRLQTFEEELKLLLESQPDKCLALGDFMATYQKCYGHKCRVASYGFNKLVELIESMPSIAKLQGAGDHRVVYLPGRAKIQKAHSHTKAKPDNKAALQLLSRELKEILKESVDHRVAINEVMLRYYQHYERHMKVGELGFRTLPELLQSLPGLQFVEKDGTGYLLLPPKITLKSAAADVLSLLQQQEGHFLLVNRLPAAYRKLFNRKFPIGQVKLEDLVRSLGNDVQLKGSSYDRILLLLSAAERGMPQKRRKLADKLAVVLMKYPECKVALSTFNDLFCKQYGHHIKPKEFHCRDLTTLLNELSDVVEVRGCADVRMKEVCLNHLYGLKMFASEIVKVFSSQPVLDKPLGIDEFHGEYSKLFGRQMVYGNCGFSSLQDLLKSIPTVVKISNSGTSAQVQLSPLQVFALETDKLLSLNDGCVSLNRFAPAYQQHYGRPCRASDYGYSRIVEVLNAIPHIVRTLGKGSEKMVVSVEGDLVLDIESAVTSSSHSPSRQETPTSAGSSIIDNSESDSDSVVVEEETDELPADQGGVQSNRYQVDVGTGADLISLSNGACSGAVGFQPSINDWLSSPVPDCIPEPSIRPAVPDPSPVGDLISFTEFDTDELLTGLSDISQLPDPMESFRFEPDSEIEDLEVAAITNMNKDTCDEASSISRDRSISDLEQLEALLKKAIFSGEVCRQPSKDIAELYTAPYMVEQGACSSSQKKSIPVHVSTLEHSFKASSETVAEENSVKQIASTSKQKKGAATSKVRLAANFTLDPKK